jgi:Lrp/AsnC family leucine-responsive transcriptional regulator
VRVQLARHDPAIDRSSSWPRCSAWDEVVACHALTGDMDYLLHVVVPTSSTSRASCSINLLNAAGVADVNSSFVLRAVKQAQGLPLPRV